MSRKVTIQQNACQTLEKKRDALRHTLAGNISSLHKPVSGIHPGDMVDAAAESVHDTVNSQLAEVESNLLLLTERALEQARKGERGKCEGCGRKIPKARLAASPSTLCVKCQGEMERQGVSTIDQVDWSRLVDSSDGDTADLPKNPGKPFLWVLVGNSPAPAPFGKVVRLDGK